MSADAGVDFVLKRLWETHGNFPQFWIEITDWRTLSPAGLQQELTSIRQYRDWIGCIVLIHSFSHAFRSFTILNSNDSIKLTTAFYKDKKLDISFDLEDIVCGLHPRNNQGKIFERCFLDNFRRYWNISL